MLGGKLAPVAKLVKPMMAEGSLGGGGGGKAAGVWVPLLGGGRNWKGPVEEAVEGWYVGACCIACC